MPLGTFKMALAEAVFGALSGSKETAWETVSAVFSVGFWYKYEARHLLEE